VRINKLYDEKFYFILNTPASYAQNQKPQFFSSTLMNAEDVTSFKEVGTGSNQKMANLQL